MYRSLLSWVIVLFFILTSTTSAQVVYDTPMPDAKISEGTAIGGQDQVINPDGTVVAEPFADAVDIVVLEDGSALVADHVMGFVVGFGGQFGNQFQPFGNVPGAQDLFYASDGALYVTGADDQVFSVDAAARQVGFVCGGVAAPSDVRRSTGGSGNDGQATYLVADETAGTVTVADATTNQVLDVFDGTIATVATAEGYTLAVDDVLVTTNAVIDTPSVAPTSDRPLLPTDVPWWAWVLLLAFFTSSLFSVWQGRQTTAKTHTTRPTTPQYDAANDPHGGSVDMVPADPCAALRAQLAEAKDKAVADKKAADAAAEADRDAAATSASTEEVATDAAAAQAAADRESEAAQAEVRAANEEPVEGDSASSDGYTFTSRDKTLKERAVAVSEAAHQAGNKTAAEHSSLISELNTKEGTDRLRAEDNANRAQRQQEANDAAAEAESAVAEATQATQAAQAAAQAAADEAAEASRNAAATAAAAVTSGTTADDAQTAYDECMKTSRAAWSAEEADRKKEYDESIERQDNQPPMQYGTAEELLGGQSGSGQKAACCENGVWVGVGYGGGGTFFVGGKEYAHMLWTCTCNSYIFVEVVIETWRAGPGLGGEGTVHVGMITGATHASQIPGLLKGDADGVGWDLSLGGSAKQAATAAGETGSALKNLAKAVKNAADKDTPLSAIAKNENVAKAAKSLAASAQSTTVKTATGAAESGGQVVKISVGPSLQVGVWYGFGSSVFVNSYNSCGCKVGN